MAAHTTDLRTSILCLSLLSEVASQLAGCFLQACVLLSAVVQSQSGLAVVLCLTPQAAFYGVLEKLSTLGATERSLHCKGPPRPWLYGHNSLWSRAVNQSTAPFRVNCPP